MSWQPKSRKSTAAARWQKPAAAPEAVANHHAAGKLTVRERIARLLDPGTFREVGKLAGSATYDAAGQLHGLRAGART